MVVNSVSGVRFCANDMLSRPGAYAREIEQQQTVVAQEPAEKKGSKTKKVVVGTLITAAALLAGSAALKHFLPDTFKVLSSEELAQAGIVKKLTHYVATVGDYLITKSGALVEGVKGLFHRNNANNVV